ncbi:hypothetical protein ACFQLZ_09935 [Halospeciosus flavus]
MYRLHDITDDNASEPIVVRTLPVAIEQALLHKRLNRVSDLLERVPIPLSQAQIPNGVIREHLLGAADEATTYSHNARSAQSRFMALQHLSHARENARYVAAGWAYVEHDRTESELQSEYEQAVSDARSLEQSIEYRGDDPVRAALVYSHLERNLEIVLDYSEPHVYESSPLLTVAEWGEHAESARARTDDTQYLYDQYTASLPKGASNVKDTLTTAAETLAAQLQQKRTALPPEPNEYNEGPGPRVSYRLRDRADSSARDVAEPIGPARAVTTAVEGFTNFAAYEQVRTNLEKDTDAYRIQNASDVREIRDQALASIRTALKESPRPALARPVLADAAMSVAYADKSLARHNGEVRAARLYDPLRQYITATARAQNVSTACQQVLDALN